MLPDASVVPFGQLVHPLWSTSPSLAPSEKPLTRLDEWQGMDQKKVGNGLEHLGTL
jgi:hypothetical protein